MKFETCEDKRDRINFNLKSPDGKIVGHKDSRINIFRPVQVHSKTHRLRKWLVDKIEKSHPFHRRFKALHKFLKPHVFYTAFKFMDKYLSKFLIREDKDIPAEAYNNHPRIFRWAWKRSVDDTYLHMLGPKKRMACQNTNQPFKFTDEEYVSFKSRTNSYQYRQLAGDILATFITEDTVDREWCNMFCMNIAHEMMRVYGVAETERKKVPKPGEFPIYFSHGPYNPDYFTWFVANRIPIWGMPYPELIRPEVDKRKWPKKKKKSKQKSQRLKRPKKWLKKKLRQIANRL